MSRKYVTKHFCMAKIVGIAQGLWVRHQLLFSCHCHYTITTNGNSVTLWFLQ